MVTLGFILVCLAVIALSLALLNEISDNKSHWQAVTHELAQVWESVNILEGVDPSKVGEPITHADEELTAK